MGKCPHCGSKKIFAGKPQSVLGGSGKSNYFQPNEIKFLTVRRIHVTIYSTTYTACAECGLLWTILDKDRLKTVIEKSGKKEAKERLLK